MATSMRRFVSYSFVLVCLGTFSLVHSQSIVDVRLFPLTNSYPVLPLSSGALDVQINELSSYSWLYVCYDDWSDANSFVACGNLGYPGYTSHSPIAPLSPTALLISCTGTESSLDECQHVTTSTCRSGHTYVSCSLRDNQVQRYIRLRAIGLTGVGRVQIAVNSVWGSICGHNWDRASANVACRQLGYGTAREHYSGVQFGQGHGTITVSSINCHGNETNLEQCQYELIPLMSDYTNYSMDGCSQRNLAGVSCNTPNYGHQESIALVDSPAGQPSVGRVVVRVGSVWGSICSNRWTIREAAVVCRQLGLGYAHSSLQDVWQMTASGQGLRTVATNVVCTGNEDALSECEYFINYDPFGADCGSGWTTTAAYVGVVCSNELPDLQLDMADLTNSMWVDVLHMNYLRCAAEERCLSTSGYYPSNSNSTRKLLRFTTSVWNRGTAAFRPWLQSNAWEWHACHGHFHSMAEFAHFDILSIDTFERAAEGHKASFCLEDSVCQEGVSKRYRCTTETTPTPQGISAGCADTYFAQYDCQWIDVTDVSNGEYYLRVNLNPLESVGELDFDNNHNVCTITLNDRSVVVNRCFIPSDQRETS
uniref:lysyl oxidase homolog 2B isoform X1 n=1 Tax=Ciona intestinalis TaxID=7719 RepID=UPI0000522E29|nr:lysyl oxidase homolog 2B isoform X1 [Ciona intestinalis]|eukprot:XP_004225737.1 lysyl oxidase homolog 2B isoform X1 [Ciona intestinalis]